MFEHKGVGHQEILDRRPMIDFRIASSDQWPYVLNMLAGSDGRRRRMLTGLVLLTSAKDIDTSFVEKAGSGDTGDNSSITGGKVTEVVPC